MALPYFLKNSLEPLPDIFVGQAFRQNAHKKPGSSLQAVNKNSQETPGKPGKSGKTCLMGFLIFFQTQTLQNGDAVFQAGHPCFKVFHMFFVGYVQGLKG